LITKVMYNYLMKKWEKILTFSKKFQKGIDKIQKVCYNIYRKRGN
jgi:hypothetical protein